MEKSYRVGRSIDNDIVLLSKAVPLEAFVIHRTGFRYDLPITNIDSYSFRIVPRLNWWIIVIVGFFFTLAVSTFDSSVSGETIGALKTQTLSKALPSKELFEIRGSNTELSLFLTENNAHDHVLHFVVHESTGSGDLEVSVNNQVIGYAPRYTASDMHEYRLFVSKTLLKVEGNVIQFRSASAATWAVSQIYTTWAKEEDRLALDADFLYQAARQVYEQKDLEEASMERVRRYLRTARSVCVDNPALKAKIEHLEGNVEHGSLDSR